MEIREKLVKMGAKIIAPCTHEGKCMLEKMIGAIQYVE